jgi:uncharacterized membrane protein
MTVQHKLVLIAISIGPPLVLWAVLYLIARYSTTTMRKLRPWVRVLRRLTSWTTLALFLLVAAGFPLSYAEMSLGFSSVVLLVDCWAFERFGSVKDVTSP